MENYKNDQTNQDETQKIKLEMIDNKIRENQFDNYFIEQEGKRNEILKLISEIEETVENNLYIEPQERQKMILDIRRLYSYLIILD